MKINVKSTLGLVMAILCMVSIQLSGQSLYKSYPQESGNNLIKVTESNSGYELLLKDPAYLSPNWTILETEPDADLISSFETEITPPGNAGFGTISLSDGTFLYLNFADVMAGANEVSFYQYNKNGGLLLQYAISLPDDIYQYMGSNLTQLLDGTLLLAIVYSTEEYNGNSTDKHTLFIHYDLENEQILSQNDVIKSTISYSYSVAQMVPATDGNVFLYTVDSDPGIKHHISKHQADGTVIWTKQVSSLERPANILGATAGGGIWYEVPHFEISLGLDANGDSYTNPVKTYLQNEISGSVTITGVVAGQNETLILASGNPQGNGKFMTLKISSDGANILNENYYDMAFQQIPSKVKGMLLADGSYLLGGELQGGTGKIPVLFTLNSAGEFLPTTAMIDLELSITGSIPNPDIYNSHSVTLTVENKSFDEATGVQVSIPQAAGDVYSGANPYDASQGSFNYWSSQIWSVGNVAAGATAEITINYFKVEEGLFSQYAQVTAANETDTDSSPSNGDGTNQNEDDEVIYGAGGFDLSPYSFQPGGNYATANFSNIDIFYSYQVTQSGAPIALDVTNKLYISTDNVFSSDDIEIGSHNTTANSSAFNQIFDNFISSSVTPGFYYLFAELDANDNIDETDETNNIIQFSTDPRLLITGPTNGLPDIVMGYLSGTSNTYDSGEQSAYGGTYVMYNTGASSSTPFLINFYLSTDQNLSNDDLLAGNYQFNGTSVLTLTPQQLSIDMDIPVNTPSGQYYVIADVDANNAISESEEDNNVRVSAQQLTINGGSNSCSPDTGAPVFDDTCPDSYSFTSVEQYTIFSFPSGLPQAVDLCDNDLDYSSTISDGDPISYGVTPVTVTATDDAGNVGTCYFEITKNSPVGGSCAGNLLENPGYDEDNFFYTGWFAVGPNEFSLTNDAHEGNNALSVAGSFSGGILQNLPAEAGETYTVEAWIKEETNLVGLRIKFLSASWQPLDNFSTGVAATGNYVFHTLTKTAPAGTAYVEVSVLRNSGNQGTFLVDSWCLTKEDTGGGNCNPDTENPILVNCPNNITVTTSGSAAIASWMPPTPTDNCDTDVFISSSHESGDVFEIGTHTVYYNAEDDSGNEGVCSFVVTVIQENESCENNSLDNSDFENGLDYWNNLGGGEITTNAFSGDFALRVCDVSGGRVIQNTAVFGGQLYDLKFVGKNESGIANINSGSVSIKWLTANWQPILPVQAIGLPSEWQSIETSYIAPYNAAYMEISIYGGSQGCSVVDDICFSMVNEVNYCELTPSYSNVVCDNTNDTYTIDVTVNEYGNCATTWYTDLDGLTLSGAYGVPTTLGPFDITDGDQTLILQDSYEPNFQMVLNVEAPSCGGGGGGTALNCDLNYNIDGDVLTISGTGLQTDHLIIKLFGSSWNTVFSCLDDCGDPIVISGLSNETYHLSVDQFDASWQRICNTLEDISVNTASINNSMEGLIELDQQRGLVLNQLYPVPASSFVNLSISSRVDTELIAQLFDGQGRAVALKTINLVEGENIFKWNIDQLPSGFYQILFDTSNGHTPIRFIKQRL